MIHAPLTAHTGHLAHRRLWLRYYRRSWGVAAAILAATFIFLAVGISAHVSWGDLLGALASSTLRVLIAYALALVLATILGLLVGSGPFGEYLFPVFDVLQNVPSFALIPLFIYFFGFSDLMIVIFAATSIIWPILFAILTAIRSARIDMNDAAAIFGATGIRRFTHYLFPLSIPAIVTGSVVGIAIGWEAVIGAEIIGGGSGFGAFIMKASEGGISATSIAGIVGILVIVFVMNRLLWSPLLSESSHRYVE